MTRSRRDTAPWKTLELLSAFVPSFPLSAKEYHEQINAGREPLRPLALLFPSEDDADGDDTGTTLRLPLTFAELGTMIGRDEVRVAALFYGQARADEEEAQKLVSALDLSHDIADALTEFPCKETGPCGSDRPANLPILRSCRYTGVP